METPDFLPEDLGTPEGIAKISASLLDEVFERDFWSDRKADLVAAMRRDGLTSYEASEEAGRLRPIAKAAWMRGAIWFARRARTAARESGG